MKLSVRIRTARLRAGMTQSELAQHLGVSRTAVVNWESGTNRARPSGERLEEICRLTGVAWEWLATGRGQAALSDENQLAVDAELVDDPIERRLLQAFRSRDAVVRQAVLTLLETGNPGVHPRVLPRNHGRL
jgi:Predicted transcriptional regulators